MALWSRLTGGIASFGIGAASADAISPVLEGAKQQARGQRAIVVLAPALAADADQRRFDVEIDGTGKAAVFRSLNEKGEVVAESTWPMIEIDWSDDAKRSGIGQRRYLTLRRLMQKLPPYAEMLTLWRRGRVDQATVDSALAHEGIPTGLWPAVRELAGERVSPQVIALAIVRGIVKDPGFLPQGPPTTVGKVKAFPQSPIDALTEAQAEGYDWDRLFIETAIMGRPMGPEAAASAVFRDILERVDFDRAVAEGDVRNEWADAIFETARQIPSVADYVNAHLRGWITEEEMNAGVARHGMSAADAHLLYLRTGRPAAPGQMATAAARGIEGPDGVPMNREQFLKGIKESDIRPEWGPMLWEARFLYPPLFQITRLVQAGAIDADTARDWAVKDRYPPEVVDALHLYWSQPAAAAADPHVAKAETHLWTALHRSYVAGESDDAVAQDTLTTLGVPLATVPRILALWHDEQLLVRRQLTPSQLKKAFAKAELNPRTGFPWTREDVLARLTAMGMSLDDANSLLDL